MGEPGGDTTGIGNDYDNLQHMEASVIGRHGTIGKKGEICNIQICKVISRIAEFPETGYGIDTKGD